MANNMARALGVAAAAAGLFLADGALAQTSNDRVWGSVAFIYHGERQPLQLAKDNSPALTPLGAQQMLAQGELFRARYLLRNESIPADLATVTGSANVQGLERNAIDNSQLRILTTSDSYMAPSALAFMQGFYPPMNQSVSNGAGGMDSAELYDGSLVNFPLGGYQYPQIKTMTSSDPESTWIQGHAMCTRWIYSAMQMEGEQALKELNWQNTDLFKRVWDKLGNPTPYSPDTVSLFSADNIYDLALYNYTHENRTRDSSLSSQDMHDLERLAARQLQSRSGNLTVYGEKPGDNIRAIGGRMLAGKVASQLRGLSKAKMTLIFGTQDPMIAFFSLASLLTTSSTKPVFERLPGHGAAMMFEVFSVSEDSSTDAETTQLPAESDLWVRFLYRNSSEAGAVLSEHPIFGNGQSQRHMPYRDFLRAMDGIAVSSVPEWCRICGAGDLFCPGIRRDANGNAIGGQDDDRDAGGLSAPAAAAVGVLATVLFFALLVLAAEFCLGFRFRRQPAEDGDAGGDNGKRERALGGGGVFFGGFKGPEKRQDDADVAYARGGIRHERTGSWELRGGSAEAAPATAPAAPPAAAVSPVGASFARGRRQDEEDAMRKDAMLDDDDTARLFHATPVQPRSSL